MGSGQCLLHASSGDISLSQSEDLSASGVHDACGCGLLLMKRFSEEHAGRAQDLLTNSPGRPTRERGGGGASCPINSTAIVRPEPTPTTTDSVHSTWDPWPLRRIAHFACLLLLTVARMRRLRLRDGTWETAPALLTSSRLALPNAWDVGAYLVCTDTPMATDRRDDFHGSLDH
jgi:hypothetical protein